MVKNGVDISHSQAKVDLAQAKSSVDFIIHKATEGLGITDPDFQQRWTQLRQLGIPRGAYHFARPENSWEAEADHFAQTVKTAGWGGKDVAALDLETTGGLNAGRLNDWATNFINRIREQLGDRILFYASLSFYLDQLGDPLVVPGAATLWIARYTTGYVYGPPLRRPKSAPDPPPIWQCSDGAHGCVHDVPGIGSVDYDHATDQTFANLWG